MTYLVDTYAPSELRRKEPNIGVLEWFSQCPASSLYLSVLTLGEIRKGIDAIEDNGRKQILLQWLKVDLPSYFNGRILPIDTSVADRWGTLIAQAGRPMPAIDSLIAATAMQHGLKLVTRNTKDFEFDGLELINPWQK